MKRRHFIGIISGATLAWPLTAAAQKTLPVIGFLGLPQQSAPTLQVLAGLNESGFVEGRDFASDYREVKYQPDQMADQASDLARDKVAIIVAITLTYALAAKAATRNIPIVFWIGSDPVATGLVDSLNHPGGNLTGSSNINVDIVAKRLEILRELVPAARTVAYLTNPNSKAYSDIEMQKLEDAARAISVRLLVQAAGDLNEIEGAFEAIVKRRPDALLVGGDALFFRARKQLADLASLNSLPSMYASREYVAAGGLASFGARYSDGFRLAGSYAGRILKGESPSDLPVQQITTTELVLNLQAAKALKLEVPPTLIARADETLE